MSDIACNDQRTLDIQAGLDGILGQRLAHLVHTLVQVNLNCGRHCGSLLGQETCGILLQLLDEDTVLGDLSLDVTVSRAANAQTYGARRCVARTTNNTYIVYQILTTELSTYAALLADIEHLLLPLQIAEVAATLVTRCGQVIEITSRSLLNGCEVGLSRSTTDAECQVVGRTSRSTQILDVLLNELGQVLLGQQRLGLLIQEGLVSRATTLGDEQKLILVALSCIEVDLCGQVGAAILLVEHIEGNYLRVTEVALLVGLINTASNALSIVSARINVLALLTDTDCGTRILTSGQLTLGSYALVEQHRVSHELVVVGSFGIFENVSQLLQVRRTQIERNVVVSLFCQQLQALGINFQNTTTVALNNFHIVFCKETIFRSIVFDGERLLIDEISHSVK